MMKTNRRRFIEIVGLATAAGSGGLFAAEESSNRPWQWNGILFGAAASISLYGLPKDRSKRLTRECFTRLRKLEKQFSLYESESDICRLNRDGKLLSPSPDFVSLLQQAIKMGDRTAGAFDVTVQPLWRCYREHYETATDRVDPPSSESIAKALSLVDYRKINVSRMEVSFAKPGMGITLNGIAQGFITDRVTEYLKAQGVQSTLVNLGEYRALGAHPEGRPWKLAVRRPDGEAGQSTISIKDQALAVSGGYGFTFGPGRELHHLMHPATGRCLSADRSVAVTAANATDADALATACGVVDEKTGRGFVKGLGQLRVYANPA